jgi:hypothetical protein
MDFYVDNIYVLYNTEIEKERIVNYLYNYNLKYELIKAISSNNINKINNKNFIEIFDIYINYYKNYKLNNNQISHINSIIYILKDSINKNYNSILILEYDIYFHKNINNLLKEYKNLIMNNDIIHLGSSQKYWYNIVTKTKIEYKDKYYYNNHSLGTFAIILKKNVLNMYYNYLSTYTLPSDVILTIISNKYKSIVLFPNLIICDLSKSSILENRNMLLYSIRFKWNLNDYNINNNLYK